ncbi:Fanconi anemia, complementation group I [Nesidiocoris tenuis]|uniref:Fanconi anemia, complementation group I n=1 Tax=Nesidiocoris tenuis TaxID=355587 RepID=A0ABN7AUM8_9HEMI|nr:Fanconi anemia, complementation group I [Nesidiocoris tenuis]
MSQISTYTKLIQLAQKKHVADDFVRFQQFVEELSYDEIETLVSERLELRDGPQVMNLILTGLSQKSSSQKKRVKLMEYLLTQTQEKDLFPQSVTSILTRLAIEIPKLSSPHLVRMCDLCVDFVSKTTKPQRAGWHELLPKLLNVLVEKDELDHYGTETSGEEYKKQVVSAINQAKWNPEILTPIATMFSNINLTDEEHSKVVSKLCQCIDNLMPDEVPPLVYQLLQLTANRNAMLLFFALKKYYNQRIYRLNDSSSMLDTDKAVVGSVSQEESDIETSLKGLTESEAMVLYHIEVVAQRSLGCVPELVKCAKMSIPCAEMFFDPFLIAVLLIVSNVPTYEAQVTELLQKMIVRLVNEEEKRNESDWLRKVLNTYCDTQGIICKLIKSKACELEGVMKGFLALSVSLLKYNNKTVAHFGRLIACNLISKHIVVASGLLEAVTTNIFSTPEITQFTECLDEICDSSPMTVVDYPKIVNRLLEALPNLPEPAASKVIYALISLLRVSARLRDNLLMVLRKALFVHNPATRTLAVSGFLQLLKRMRIKGMHTMSQNSFQAYTCPSVFATQSLVDVHVQNTNNEGICLEVIQVLKRCFSLQLSVKTTFYFGLHSALMKNPELCIPITEIFLEHFRTFYEPDDEKLPPLNFSKAISIVQDKVSVVEPIGHLVFVIQKIVNTSDELMTGIVDDEEYIANMEKLRKMLKSLVRRFSIITLANLGLDKDLEIKDSDGQMKEEILRQCLSIFQSLICFVVSKWDVTSTQDDVKFLLSLHRGYCNFEDCAKSMKVISSKQKNKEGSTQSAPNAGKKSSFQFPETVIDFETVFRLLSLLLGEVDWCMDEQATELKKKPSLLRFSLASALDILEVVRSKLKVYVTKTSMEELTRLGKLLFQMIIKRFEEVKEQDPNSSALGVEVFTEVCSILFTSFRRSRTSFLKEITCKPENVGLDELLQTVLKPYINILNSVVDSEDSDDEPTYKKLVGSLIAGINVLAMELPVSGSGIDKTYRWLLDLAQTKTFPILANVKTLLTLLLSLLSRAKSEATLHDNLALQLCESFGTINDVVLEKGTVSLVMVNNATKATVYPLLCNALNTRLDAVDWVVTRVKAETSLISQPDCSSTDPSSRKAVLSRKEKELVTELGLVVSVSHWICTAAVPADCAEIACKLLVHVYSSLVAFTKYFSIRGSAAYADAKFAKLVQLASHLSAQIADFLLYIESVDIDTEDGPSKKFSAKVLRQAKKMTVYIPKLVAEIENFSKCVTQLSTKFKDNDLVKNVKLTTTRDFRLNAKKLEEAMKRGHDSNSDSDEDSRLNNTTSNGSQVRTQPDPPAKKARGAGKGKKKNASSSQATKKRRTV